MKHCDPTSRQITMPTPELDFNTLADFAFGNLNSVESLRVEGELKHNLDASRNLEFILKLIAHFEHEIHSEVNIGEVRTSSKLSRRDIQQRGA
jgi:hypothetical protein